MDKYKPMYHKPITFEDMKKSLMEIFDKPDYESSKIPQIEKEMVKMKSESNINIFSCNKIN